MEEHDTASLVRSTARALLDDPEVGLDDDFFAAGGDSMLAMHLVGRLGRATGLPLRVSMLIAHPVLGDFAGQVRVLRDRAAPAADAGTPLAAALRSARPIEGDGGA